MISFRQFLGGKHSSSGKGGGSRPRLAIRRAQETDLPAICQLSSALSHGRLEAGLDPVKTGFLVSDYGQDDYKSFLDSYDMFFVLAADDAIVAFVMAISSANMEDGQIYHEIAQRQSGPFAYIKQVCTGIEYQRHGYGQMLYRHIFELTECTIYACIVEDEGLTNTRSIEFHEKLGFTRTFHYTPEDGLRRAVFRRMPDRAKMPGLLLYSMVKTGAVAAAALVLSLVVAISNADYRIIATSAIVVIYFSAVCYYRHKKHRNGELIQLYATCVSMEKLNRRQTEYGLETGEGDEKRIFHLVFPRKRRLREGEQYEMLFDLRADGALSETNLIVYRQVPAPMPSGRRGE